MARAVQKGLISAAMLLLAFSSLAFAANTEFGNSYGGTSFAVMPFSAAKQDISFIARGGTNKIHSITLLVRKYDTAARDYTLRIYADNDGVSGLLIPGGTSTTTLGDDSWEDPGRFWVNFSFSSNPSLVAGNKYHLVFDASPSASDDDRVGLAYITSSAGVGLQPNPAWPDDLSNGGLQLRTSADGTTWSSPIAGAPSFILTYADNAGAFNGFGNGNPYDSVTSARVNDTRYVSQTFTIGSSVQVTALKAMVRKVGSGTPADDLKFELRKASDNSLVAGSAGSVPKTAFTDEEYAFKTLTYGTAIVLPAGTYRFVLSSPGANTAVFYRWLAVRTNLLDLPAVGRTYSGLESNATASFDLGATWVQFPGIDNVFGVQTVDGTCSDGTVAGTCSVSKPSYCPTTPDANGVLVLINKASVCGCPVNYRDSGNNCVDNVAPVSAINALASLQTFMAGQAPLTATASDLALSGSGVASVKYEKFSPTLGWRNLGAGGNAASNYLLSNADLSLNSNEGELKLRSVATDLEGNVEANPTNFSILLDKSVPSIGPLEVKYAVAGGIQKDDAKPGEPVIVTLHNLRDASGFSAVELSQSNIASLAQPTWSRTKLKGEPLAWFRFDYATAGAVKDFSGYGNDAILSGSAGLTPLGRYAGAAALATGGFMHFPRAAVAGAYNDFTISFWAKPTATVGANTEGTGNLSSGTLAQRYALFPSFVGSAGSVDVAEPNLAAAGVSVGTNGVRVIEHAADYAPAMLVHDTAIPSNGWTHVAVVYSGNKPTLYVNGAFVKDGAQSAKRVRPGYFIGSVDAAGTYGAYEGGIDDLRIWNRSLTANEVGRVNNSQALSSDLARYKATFTIPTTLDEGDYAINFRLADTAIPVANALFTQNASISVRRAGFAAAQQGKLPAGALIGAAIIVALLLAGYSVWTEKPKRK